MCAAWPRIYHECGICGLRNVLLPGMRLLRVPGAHGLNLLERNHVPGKRAHAECARAKRRFMPAFHLHARDMTSSAISYMR
jgi:hypothetical protein